jgi:hypothetical protein
MAGEGNPFFGKKHLPETIALLRAAIDPKQRASAAAGNTNVRGRRWWNDGTRSYMLDEEPAKARGLVPGRIWKRAAAGVAAPANTNVVQRSAASVGDGA